MEGSTEPVSLMMKGAGEGRGGEDRGEDNVLFGGGGGRESFTSF